jgi:tetratricopeptide (TPR) repeat protein
MNRAPDAVVVNNRYQILDMIGSGGMGNVYRAMDRLTGDQVAVKQIRTEPAPVSDPTPPTLQTNFRMALAQEFRTLASLRHPYIISVLDYGFDAQRRPFFTMSLLEDKTSIVKYSTDKPLQTKLDVIIQLFEALRYLHHHHIIHRDLKPENVVVTGGQVKVLDFGLALMRERSGGIENDDSVIGTIPYIAPEIFQGFGASELSDLYAAGLITYEVLTGSYPFDSSSMTKLLKEILDRPPDFAVLDNAIPQDTRHSKMRSLLERSLQKNPKDRYQRVADVLAEFREIAGQALHSDASAVRESYLQPAELVGRDLEMMQLVAMLEQMLEGNGSAWLIGGESGVGKSRLVDELRIQALVAGVVVLQGGAVADGGSPFQPWRDVIKRLILQSELSILEASILKPLIPDIDRLVGYSVADAPDIGAVASFNRFIVTITDLFIRQTEPLVVLLEDLQWSSESVEILKKLTPQLDNLPLLIVGTFRSDERPTLASDIPNVSLLQLEPLSAQAVEALSAVMVGERGRTQEVVELLTFQTEGNALFIIEVMRALLEELGSLENVGTATIPPSLLGGGVQKVIAHRISRIPEAFHPLLDTTAVIGSQIDLLAMEKLFPKAQIEEWLQICSDASLLRVQDDKWRFAHDKIRETLLAQMNDEKRRSLFRKVAEASEAAHDPDAFAPRLAHYWENANDPAREAYYRALSGTQALDNGAFAEAARHFERLLTLQREGLSSVPIDRARVKRKLSIAYFQLGRMNEAIDTALGAIAEISTPVPSAPRGLMRQTMKEMLRQVWYRIIPFSVVENSPAERDIILTCAECFHQISEAAAYYSNRALTGYSSFRGLNLIEQYGASPALAYSYSGFGWFISTTGRWRMAKTYLSLADKVIDQLNDPRTSPSKFPIAIAYTGRGLWDDAWRHAQECVDGANLTGDWRNWRQATGLKGDILFFTGKYNQMLKCYLDGYALAERVQDVSQMAIQKAIRSRALFVMGQYDEAKTIAQEAMQLESPSTMTTFNAQPVFILDSIRSGRLEEVMLHATDLMDALRKNSLIIYVALDGYAANAYAWLYLLEKAQGNLETLNASAEEACKLLRRFAKSYPIGVPRSLIYNGWRLHLSGQAAQATKSIEAGLKKAQELKMPYDEGLAYMYLGRLQPSQLSQHFAEAKEVFEQIGAGYPLEQLAGLSSGA